MTDSHSAATMTQPPVHPPTHGVGLRVIAVYELIKVVCLLPIAVAAFHFEHTDNFMHLVHWLEHLPLTGSNELRWKLVHMLVDFGPSHFVALGMVALAYAVVFTIEGLGLWFRKRWAEWFTVIATAVLIPLELYEVLEHGSWLKLAVLIGNVAIVIYLIHVARQQERR